MNALDRIIAVKKEEAIALRRRHSPSSFRDLPGFSTPIRPLSAALRAGTHPSVIAEIKKASPSAGVLNASVHPPDLALLYRDNGAAGISVLTDTRFFGGSPADLADVRSAVDLPLLRKDFIVDEIQVYESKSLGADAILLISSIMEPGRLRDLHRLASGLGLECLVEVHHPEELDGLDFAEVRLVGINNRDLRDFTIDLGTTGRIAGLLPPHVVSVSESGLRSAADVRAVTKSGIDAVLIGEYLILSRDPGESLRNLIHELRED